MKIYSYNEFGQPCDKFGKVIRQPEIVADGESIHVNMLFMDNAQRTVHDACNDGNDSDLTPYDIAIRDGWKNGPTKTANTTATPADAAAAYEERIANAWKTIPADYAA